MIATLAPQTAAEAAALLGDAAREHRRLVPGGAGSKRTWHPEHAAHGDILSLAGLVDGFTHYAGDLVATIPAGMRLADANRELRRNGQWLPLDPVFADRATIGGLVAANDAGPRRHRYGTPRDLIVGIEIALTDGRLVHAGGRVVKNVAGYDLSRLFCGSHGSLGVITSATFKLSPVAPQSLTLVARFDRPDNALAFVHALAHSPVAPSTIDLRGPDWMVLVRFETTTNAAERMAETAHALATTARCEILIGDAEDALWAEQQALRAADALVLKASVLPTDVGALLDRVTQVTGNSPWLVSGHAALGVLFFAWPADVNGVADAICRTVEATRALGGHHVLTGGSAELRAQFPSAPAPAGAVIRAVKQRFDPHGVLPPSPGSL